MRNLCVLVTIFMFTISTTTRLLASTKSCKDFFNADQKLFGNEINLIQQISNLLQGQNKAPHTESNDSKVVGIPTEEFFSKTDPEGRGRQKCGMWCWAAATQMVGDFYDIHRPQDKVAAEYGVNSDGAGTPKSIIMANTGIFQTNDGRTVKLDAVLARNYDEIIEDLENHRPLIVGIDNKYIPNSGHEYVLTAATYIESRLTRGAKIQSLILRDPMPGRPSRQEFDVTTEGSRVDHVIRIIANPIDN